MVAHNDWTFCTGRRKTAVARVRIKPGSGQFLIHKQASKADKKATDYQRISASLRSKVKPEKRRPIPVEEYFHRGNEHQECYGPLKLTNTMGRYDVVAIVNGGGYAGQATAVAMGLARCLYKLNPELRELLRSKGYLTRDSRKVERKKYGRAGARRSFQFSKR